MREHEQRWEASGTSPPPDFTPEEFEALLEYFRTLKRWKEEAEMSKVTKDGVL